MPDDLATCGQEPLTNADNASEPMHPYWDTPKHVGVRAAQELFKALNKREEPDDEDAEEPDDAEEEKNGESSTDEDKPSRLKAKALQEMVSAARQLIDLQREIHPHEEEQANYVVAGWEIGRTMLEAFDLACAAPEDASEEARHARTVLEYVFFRYSEWLHPWPDSDGTMTDFDYQIDKVREKENVRKMFELSRTNALTLQEAQYRVLNEIAGIARDVGIYRELALRLDLDDSVLRAACFWPRMVISTLFRTRTLESFNKTRHLHDVEAGSGFVPSGIDPLAHLDFVWSVLSLWYVRGRKKKGDSRPDKWEAINRLLGIAGLQSSTGETLKASWEEFKRGAATMSDLERRMVRYDRRVTDDKESRQFRDAAVALGLEEFHRLDALLASEDREQVLAAIATGDANALSRLGRPEDSDPDNE
jgi:hypothetical protein